MVRKGGGGRGLLSQLSYIQHGWLGGPWITTVRPGVAPAT